MNSPLQSAGSSLVFGRAGRKGPITDKHDLADFKTFLYWAVLFILLSRFLMKPFRRER